MKNPKTLLVDGNYLLKRSFHNHSNNKLHDTTTYSFLVSLRKLIDSNNYNKVVVMWDGNNSGYYRYKDYPKYKANRESKSWFNKKLDEKKLNFLRENSERVESQKLLIKNILENLYIRQLEIDKVEGDDLISCYCDTILDEKIHIFTNDRDMLQLIKYPNVSIIFSNKNSISLDEKKVYNIYNHKNYKKIIPYHFENIVLIKSLVGDNSDNIEKVQRVTVNYLMKEFPELSEREITLGYLLNKLQEKNKLKVADKNLLNIDKKKHNLIKKIVNLINNQYLTEEIIDNVNLIKEGELAIYNEEKKYFRGGSNLYSILQGTEVLKNYLGFTTPFKDKYLHFITPFCKIIYHEQKKLLNSNVILKEEKEFLDNSIKKTKKIYIKHETDKKQIEERKRF